MALYDKKIQQYSHKAEQLEKRIRADTKELEWLHTQIKVMRFSALCDELNCDEQNIHTLLAREHEQIQKMKHRGLTDAEIDALGKEEKTEEKYDEKKIF